MRTTGLVLLLVTAATGGPTGCMLFQSSPGPYLAEQTTALERSPGGDRWAGAEELLAPEQVPRTLTLEQCLALCRHRDPALRASFLRLEAARARVARAHSPFFPSLHGAFSAGRTMETPRQLRTTATGVPLPSSRIRYATFATSLNATWILFDGLAREYRLVGARAAEHEDRARLDDTRRLRARLVAAAFFGALMAGAQVQVAEEGVRLAQTQVEYARQRRDAGAGSDSDIWAFRMRENEALAERRAALTGERVQRILLAEILGVAGGLLPPGVRLVAPEGASGGETAGDRTDAGSLVAKALRSRPDLLRARKALERAEAAVGEMWSAFLPTLTGQVSLGHQRFDDMRFSVSDISATGSLVLSWRLFDGGAHVASMREARCLREAARMEILRLERAVVSDVMQTVEALQENLVQQKRYRENVELSKRLLAAESEAYRKGHASRSTLDLVQRDHVLSLLASAMARVREMMLRFDILVVTGRLTEETSAPTGREK